MALKIAYQQNEAQIKERVPVEVRFDAKSRNDDVELWEAFQTGSEVAFATIYKNNVSLLYNYGFKIVNNKSFIMDCIQDLFIEIWDSKERLGTIKSIKSYLYKALRRKLIIEAVKQRKKLKLSDLTNEINLETVSFEHSLIEKQNFDLQRVKLKTTLDQLTEKQKEVIHLRFYARLSYLEIAEVMSITIKGTYKLMGRSIDFLRKNMSSHI